MGTGAAWRAQAPARAPGAAAAAAKGGWRLSQKNCLVKNLKRFRKQLEREAGKLEATKCAFIPKTFKMPSEYHLFVEEFRKNPGITWILKPYIPLKARLSRGGSARFPKTGFTLNSRDDRCILPVCVCHKEGCSSHKCGGVDVIMIPGRLGGKEKCVGNDGSVSRGEDLGTPVNENIMTSTRLGCYDDRKEQLKQLFRNLPAQQKA